MALTPEEEKRLREQVRQRLEKRLKKMSETNSEDVARQSKMEERLRKQIMEEEEERFYTERGYVKYVNHRGGVEWLTPEEAEERKSKRRTGKGSSRRKKRQIRKVMQWVVNVVAVLMALGIFGYLWRYNPNPVVSVGTMVVESDVPGAQVFVNGIERSGYTTPARFTELATGTYFVSVYKEGYSAWPPMQKIVVEKGKTSVAQFQIKSAGQMGTLQINVDQADVEVFIDGIKRENLDLNHIEIPAGFHVITVVKDGYLAEPPFQRVLIRENESAQVRFQMLPASDLGYLKIHSNRASGYIYLSNRFTGIKTNNTAFPVVPGVYEIRVVENDYYSLPEKEFVRIEIGKTLELNFNLQPVTHRDTLQLLTPKPGANIVLNGDVLPYVTPMPQLVVNSGINYINLMRNGQLYDEKDLVVNLAQLKKPVLEYNF
jgi:hypothetical protein